MKIAFDEHIPAGMVRVFESLVSERKLRRLIKAEGKGLKGGYEIVRSADYNPSPRDINFVQGSDVPWIQKFANDGGSVIISGDVRARI